MAFRPFTSLALGALWIYQRALSPVFYFFGARCRHYPTCSQYSIEAFRRYGAWRGSWITLARLSRCHPFGSHGWDPVPDNVPQARFAPWRYGDWAWTARPVPCAHACESVGDHASAPTTSASDEAPSTSRNLGSSERMRAGKPGPS